MAHGEDTMSHLCSVILSRKKNRPTLVAIDGVDAAGKTTFADGLASRLNAAGRQVIRASIDGFHNPREVRYRQGRNSPNGYYEDSFNYRLLKENLLEPLCFGSLEYREVGFDYRMDTALEPHLKKAKADAILVMDGIFLLRPSLVSYWDIKVFLEVGFDAIVPRAILRAEKEQNPESAQEIIMAYEQRYIPGQKLYFEESCPQNAADIVIDNTDFDNPKVLRSNLIG